MSDVRLPVNFIQIGESNPDDVKVYIHKDVYESLEKYSRIDTDNERGTILIGDYVEEHGKMHVVVSDYIEAKYTDASASTLTFTHKTWDYVQKIHDEKFSDKKIIGWQHTHPSYGIFLSNYDLFIQNNFFDMPFQIAYVIDPIQNIRGFFGWKKDETVKLDGFYIYAEEGEKIEIKTKTSKSASKDKKREDRDAKPIYTSKVLIAALVFLAISMAALLFITINLTTKYNSIVRQQKSVEKKVDEQNKTIDNQKKKIKNLKEQNKETKSNYIIAKVKKGDNMHIICKRYGLDFEKNISEIQKLNNYIDLNMLNVGQEIKLPKK